jgi:Flp pilus assembly protein TadD
VDAGLAYAQKLAKMSPKYAPNYNSMGYMYLQKNDMDKAKAALEKYIALAPKEPNAYDSMGEFYAITKDYAKSAEYYDKAVAMGLDDAKVRAEKARSMIK